MAKKRGEQQLLREVTLKRIQYTVSKAIVSEVEVYRIVKDFFREYLDINYEYTHEEIRGELDKVYLEAPLRAAIHELLAHISKFEYSDVSVQDAELRRILRQFDGLVRRLIPSRAVKRNVWDVLLRRSRIDSALVDDFTRTTVPEPRKEQLQHLLVRINSELANKDKDALKRLYTELLQLYDALEADEKQEYFVAINEVYEKLTGI
ncbi:MAG: hypothetical protein ABIH41_03000 [Nanoarchaeota archaeon]